MNRGSTRKLLIAMLLVPLSFGAAFAEENIPVRNWTVPMYSLDGLGKAVDATPPRAFIGLPPCRVIDTRGGAPLGGGIFANSEARNFDVDGICGIPAGTDAISANFTVTGSPSAPPGAFILAYPTGSPPSPIVSLLNFQAGQTIANAGIVPLNGAGSLTINVSHSTHVIMDVNGYFSDTLGSPGNTFSLTNDGGLTMNLSNASTTCTATCGLLVSVASNAGARAIRGAYTGTGAGQCVRGDTAGTAAGAAGVIGIGNENVGGPSPFVAGVFGENDGTSGNDTGVFGWGQNRGVTGWRVNATGGLITAGVLGFTGTSGVHSFHDITAVGVKSFVEPHPTDPALEIAYISLEGNEAGTYFRGKGRFQNGLARISVPEDFRLVSDGEGLSIQVTPIAEMATVAVLRINLNEIVVKGSRNVEFFYTVNGVRKGRSGFEPVRKNGYFRPADASDKMLEWRGAVRQKLIQNGILNADGTPNLETAERLGWKTEWEKHAAEAKAIRDAQRDKEASEKKKPSKS